MVVWFIGLSGSGKTTISSKFIKEINEGIKSTVPIAYLRKAACGAGTSPSKYLTVAVTATNRMVVNTIHIIPAIEWFKIKIS